MITDIQQETKIIFAAIRPVILPPRYPSLSLFPLLPSILGKSNHYLAFHLISYRVKPWPDFEPVLDVQLFRFWLGLVLLQRTHLLSKWDIRGP